jgi:hypothetical protein
VAFSTSRGRARHRISLHLKAIRGNSVTGQFGDKGNSVTGNKTPKLREFRSQPPNRGVALAPVVGSDGRTLAAPSLCFAADRESQAAYSVVTSTVTICPVCTKSTAVAIRAAIRRRVGQ